MGGHWPLSLPSAVITSQIVLMMMMPAIRRRKGSCLLFVNLFCINVYLSCISELLCTNTSVECRTGNTKKCCYYVTLIWPQCHYHYQCVRVLYFPIVQIKM